MLSYLKQLEARLPKPQRLLPDSLSGYSCDTSQLKAALQNWWEDKPIAHRKLMYSMDELVMEFGWPKENIGRALRNAGWYQRRIEHKGSAATARRWYPPHGY